MSEDPTKDDPIEIPGPGPTVRVAAFAAAALLGALGMFLAALGVIAWTGAREAPAVVAALAVLFGLAWVGLVAVAGVVSAMAPGARTLLIVVAAGAALAAAGALMAFASGGAHLVGEGPPSAPRSHLAALCDRHG